MITEPDTPPVAPAQLPASTFDIIAPYAAGPEVHIQVHGDNDAGGQDKTSPTVAGSVAAAMARQHELETDTFGQGGTIGDVIGLVPGPSTASVSDRPYWEEA
jgi:hypothetical protein